MIVHETVQPVIHKEVVQPEVVHTTVPIHEIHHGSAQHHGISALPMKTLEEFQQAGGALTGSKTHTHEEYEGAPRPYNEKLSTTLEKVLPGHHSSSGMTSGTGMGTGAGMTGADMGSRSGMGSHSGMGAGAGMAGAGAGAGMLGSREGRTRRGSSSSSSSSSDGEGGRMSRRKKHGGRDAATGATASRLGTTQPRHETGRNDQYGNRGEGYQGEGQQHKPSMMDKLNPKVDANNDGKPGFMK